MSKSIEMSTKGFKEELKRYQFEYYRDGSGSHEIWRHKKTGLLFVIPSKPKGIKSGIIWNFKRLIKKNKIEKID